MKYFVFDIDGTLIDTAAVDRQAFRQALLDAGYDFAPEQLHFAFGMPGRPALRQLGVAEADIEDIVAQWEKLAYARLNEVPVYDGIVPLLEKLHAAGAKCGIVTSRTRSQLERGFSPLGLDHLFDTIVCADEVEHPKPAPDEMIECLRRLGGTAEQAIFVGDSVYDMQCAASAGVTSGLALWGCHEPEKMQADHRFAHPSEIASLL